MLDSDILNNLKEFGFITENEYIYSWRNVSIDIDNYLLISKDNILRFKNLSELWNYFIVFSNNL